jgi:hypothetical protein
MGARPRFRSPTTAAIRDKTWPEKRKGLVEVSRRRRLSVYPGSTPEIEIVRTGPAEAARQIGWSSTSLLARKSPQTLLLRSRLNRLVSCGINHLVNHGVRSAVHSKRSTKLRFRDLHTALNGNSIFQPQRNESILIRSHPWYLPVCATPLGKLNKTNKVAEREGFEPPIPVKVYTLSRRAPSATRPSLRARFAPVDTRILSGAPDCRPFNAPLHCDSVSSPGCDWLLHSPFGSLPDQPSGCRCSALF